MHNLEHGAVFVLYGSKVPAATVQQLRDFYNEETTGSAARAADPKLGDKIALGAWTVPDDFEPGGTNGTSYLATCTTFDEDAFSGFRDELRFRGPERFPPTRYSPAPRSPPAGVAELADAADLKSAGLDGRAGSTPAPGTVLPAGGAAARRFPRVRRSPQGSPSPRRMEDPKGVRAHTLPPWPGSRNPPHMPTSSGTRRSSGPRSRSSSWRCPYADISDGVAERLRYPERAVMLSVPVKMDDGRRVVFAGYRVQHSSVLGPTKGGIRYDPEVTLGECAALAVWMTWKCALLRLPYGGAKGGVRCNPRQMSLREIQGLTRRFTSSCCR